MFEILSGLVDYNRIWVKYRNSSEKLEAINAKVNNSFNCKAYIIKFNY